MGNERRIHTRVETNLGCMVRTDDGRTFAGLVTDLSRSGGAIVAPAGSAGERDQLAIQIAGLTPEAGPITALGEVVRAEKLGKSDRYGIRFSSLTPEHTLVLRVFLDQAMTASGIEEPDRPKVFRRISVPCGTVDEFRSVIQNISSGGLGAFSEAPVVVGELVAVAIEVSFRSDPLLLPGVVAHVRAMSKDRNQVGIKFAVMSEDKRAKVDQAIEDLSRSLVASEP